jgi:hypothetical protein
LQVGLGRCVCCYSGTRSPSPGPMQQVLSSMKGTSSRHSGKQQCWPRYKWLLLYSAFLGVTVVLLPTDTMAVLHAALLTLLAPTALGRSINQRQSGPPPTVEIQNGTVQGVYQPTYKQDLFLGRRKVASSAWCMLTYHRYPICRASPRGVAVPSSSAAEGEMERHLRSNILLS